MKIEHLPLEAYFLLSVGGAVAITKHWHIIVLEGNTDSTSEIWGRSEQVQRSYNNFLFQGETPKAVQQPVKILVTFHPQAIRLQ